MTPYYELHMEKEHDSMEAMHRRKTLLTVHPVLMYVLFAGKVQDRKKLD